jgi:S1-C subfamily serine protease
VGDPVYAVGAPQGLELSLSEGIISQLRGGGPHPIIQTTVAISPGSSGGGLFNAKGELVGITTFYLKDGQSLNFALPVEWIGEIARKIIGEYLGPIPEDKPIKTTPRTRIPEDPRLKTWSDQDTYEKYLNYLEKNRPALRP